MSDQMIEGITEIISMAFPKNIIQTYSGMFVSEHNVLFRGYYMATVALPGISAR